MARDRIADLMAALKKNEIDYLRFELPDLHGTSRSKTVPVDKVEGFARRGLNFYGGVLGLDTSSNVVPASELHTQRNYADQALFPDPELAARRPLAGEDGKRRLPRILGGRRTTEGRAALGVFRARQTRKRARLRRHARP